MGDLKTRVLTIQLNNGEKCEINQSANYIVTLQIECDDTMESGKFALKNTESPDPSKTCDIKIIAKSKHGCSLTDYYAVEAFLKNNKILIGIIVVIVGIFFCFLGSKMIIITLVIIAFLSTCILVFVFVAAIVGQGKLTTTVGWILFSLAVVLGVICSYVFYKYIKVFYAVLGGLTGYILAASVYTYFLRYIEANPTVVYWVTVGVLVLIGILVGIYLSNHLIIIATSIIGSYLMIRGSSLWIGGFPSESEMLNLINKKEYDQLAQVRLLLLTFSLSMQKYIFTLPYLSSSLLLVYMFNINT